jgi:hypothetical protein
MEDVAHGVWFDRCVDSGSELRVAPGGARPPPRERRGCRLFDPRFAKAPTPEDCRPDAHTIGSVTPAPAVRLAAKAGRKGDCGCLGGAQGHACKALPPLEPELRCGGSDVVLGRPSANADTRPGASAGARL